MLRPLFVSPYAVIGGAEMLLLRMLETMRGDLDSTVLLMEDGALAPMLRERGIPTLIEQLTGRSAARRFPRVAVRLARHFKDQGISLVHANGIKAAVLGVPLARLLGVPLVWMKHDHAKDGAPTWLVGALCDRIVCVSGAMVAALPRHLRDRASLVYPGTALPSRIAPIGPRQLIAAPGRLDPAKGFADLIRATAILRDRGVAAEIEVAGPEDRVLHGYGEELRVLVRELGLTEHARVGLAPDISSLYSEARVVSIASRPGARGRPGEGAPTVLIDGMSHGRPVVAPREGGIPEVVGNAGILLDEVSPARLADALQVYLEDPKAAADAGLRGRRRVEERFTIANTVQKLRSVYEELV